jgi:hypothetical protein
MSWQQRRLPGVAESLAFSSVTSSKRLMEKNAFSPVI